MQARKFIKSKAGKEAIAKSAGVRADTAAAIYMYTCESPLYRKLNERLRARDRKVLLQYFPYLRLLLEGFRAMRSGKKRMVNRGVKLDLVGKYPDTYAKDESLTWWQVGRVFFLTAERSTHVETLAVLEHDGGHIGAEQSDVSRLGWRQDHLPGTLPVRTVFAPSRNLPVFGQILTDKAIDVSPFSAIPDEAELLLPPGICLIVTGVLPKDASGLTIVTCEDDEDAPPMIK